MTNSRWSLGVLAVVVGFATPVFAQQDAGPAGQIKTVSGTAFIVRNNALIPVQAGQVVYEADSLRTGVDGKVGVTLKDDTRLALGPSSEARLERVSDAPGNAKPRSSSRAVLVCAGNGQPRNGAEVRARRHRVCFGPPRQTGARFHSPRNT